MRKFIESICIQDGEVRLLKYHQHRLNRTLANFFDSSRIVLGDELKKLSIPLAGQFKCRVIYGKSIESVEFIPYQVAPIKSLQVIEADLDYTYKSADRSGIDQLFQNRGECDDILITRNGLVTDSSYSNILFHVGQRWITPDTPMLRGVMRQKLLDEGIIKEKRIEVKDIRTFKSAKLINSMRSFDGPEIDVTDIVL